MPSNRATTVLQPLLLRCPAALLAAALAGCVSHAPPPEPTTIQVRDRSVFQPGVRISTNFVRGPSAPADAQGGHGIEFGAMRRSATS